MRWSVFATAGLLLLGSFAVSARQTTSSATTTQAQPKQSTGFNLPPNAADDKNPFAGDAKAVEAGKALFDKNCKRCHGPAGKGDGPDADPDVQEDMDLTVARRAARNPDGVVFWKIHNGRARPKMPSFKDDLSKDQMWQIVSFVQTLRAKS